MSGKQAFFYLAGSREVLRRRRARICVGGARVYVRRIITIDSSGNVIDDWLGEQNKEPGTSNDGSPIMIRFVFQNRHGAVELLEEKEPHHLVTESQS